MRRQFSVKDLITYLHPVKSLPEPRRSVSPDPVSTTPEQVGSATAAALLYYAAYPDVQETFDPFAGIHV